MRNRTTAALLAFFLGGIGGQFFYLGRAGAGIACLLFCWTFIPCFIALYHFIKFLTMTDGEFNAQYNQIAGMPMYAAAAGGNVGDELSKLHDLKEKGVLTDEEFAARKAKLLA